mgnify:CR=1 FL=1
MRREQDLTRDEIAQIKGMAARKDRQVDIAYWFGVPQTVVWRILNDEFRQRHVSIPTASIDQLPEKGPYKIVSAATFNRLTDAAAVPSALLVDLLARISAVQSSIDNLRIRTQMEAKEHDDGPLRSVPA